jgi:hypothetical protein
MPDVRERRVEVRERGIAFIETCLKSNRKQGGWTSMPQAI